MAEHSAAADAGGDAVSILVVDDDRVLRERLAKALIERGYDVRTAADYDSAIAVAHAEPPELAVVDLRIPGGSGIDLVRALKQLDTATLVVVLTGYGSIATALEAVRLGATHYLQKPADADEIIAAFRRDGGPGTAASLQEYAAPSLARAEWEHINRILADCDWNISEAARRLGIHRRSLQRKLQKRPPTE
jgi:two-component system response regulator RegA